MTNFEAILQLFISSYINKITVKEDKVSEFFPELADKTDKAVEAIEPGMLHHTFDQDPENPSFCMVLIAYKNDEAF